MNDEIKEVIEWLEDEDIYVEDYGYKYKRISLRETKKLLDYITNLQEQLHQASLDIQELTEKDLYCPTNCDKLTNLQKEIKKIIYQLEHNPRTNAEIRDKYIVEQLKRLLESKGE